MENRLNQRKTARRALLLVSNEEKTLRQMALRKKNHHWKRELEKKIPPKVYEGLVGAFSAGFALVFHQGRGLIEKTYDKRMLQKRHQQRHSALWEEKDPQGWRQMKKSAARGNGWNLTATAAEGIALGILGVGLPDIVLFLTTLLKGIYETALNYGFAYDSIQEQYLILAMMRASLAYGAAWEIADREVESLFEEMPDLSQEMLKESIQKTASVFAMDMLFLKFVQGMPVVGFLGGMANPVYYQKVMDYVQLKYKKRYLLKQL